jgi:hypothetical protein
MTELPRSDFRTVLEPWFLHWHLADQIVGDSGTLRPGAFDETGFTRTVMSGMAAYEKARELAALLDQDVVADLAIALLKDEQLDGRLVTNKQAYYFRRDFETERIYFHATLDTDAAVKIQGTASMRWIPTSSGFDALSGRQRQFLLAYVEQDASTGGERMIDLRPILFARRLLAPPAADNMFGLQRLEMAAEEIDQFAKMRDEDPPTDNGELKSIPEQQIKEWIAEIVGEPVVPKDSGAETFDLFTDRITIAGEAATAAFLLKGPAGGSRFKAMTIGMLGANGDQIDRLFTAPADVLVIQHCHSISAPVRNMMERYAFFSIHHKRYVLMDGWRTLQLLRAYGKL